MNCTQLHTKKKAHANDINLLNNGIPLRHTIMLQALFKHDHLPTHPLPPWNNIINKEVLYFLILI